LTVAPAQKLSIAELYQRFTSAAVSIAALEYIGPLETSAGRYDGLIEREPAGAPLTGRKLGDRAARTLVAQLCEIVARAHATGFILDGIRPELVYVDEQLRVTGIAPRCERFLMTATSPSMGVMHCFDHVYSAPEASRAALPGPPADVFALTALLAELVADEHPFVGDDPMTQLFSVSANTRRPWRGPEELRELVARGLASNAHREALVRERRPLIDW
jgi:serine/threonine protein kinase